MSGPRALMLLRSVQFTAARRSISSSACANGIKSRWQAPLRREFFRRHEHMKSKGLLPKNIRSQYFEWNYDSEIYAFGQRLQEDFNDSLLRQALTNSSYIVRETARQQELGVETPGIQMNSNSELAAEGKAIILDYSAKFIRTCYPLLPEEGVRALVDYLTSVEVLSDIGNGIGLKDLILAEEYPPSPATVATTFQAVVAALKASSDLNHCHTFVKDFVMTQLVGKNVYDLWKIEDPVSILSNILLRSGQGEPEPRLVFQTGKKTIEAVYQVAMYSNKQFLGTGYGETVAVAVEQAAGDALRRLFQTTEASPPLPFGKEADTLKLHDKKNLSLDDWSVDKARNIVMC